MDPHWTLAARILYRMDNKLHWLVYILQVIPRVLNSRVLRRWPVRAWIYLVHRKARPRVYNILAGQGQASSLLKEAKGYNFPWIPRVLVDPSVAQNTLRSSARRRHWAQLFLVSLSVALNSPHQPSSRTPLGGLAAHYSSAIRPSRRGDAI